MLPFYLVHKNLQTLSQQQAAMDHATTLQTELDYIRAQPTSAVDCNTLQEDVNFKKLKAIRKFCEPAPIKEFVQAEFLELHDFITSSDACLDTPYELHELNWRVTKLLEKLALYVRTEASKIASPPRSEPLFPPLASMKFKLRHYPAERDKSVVEVRRRYNADPRKPNLPSSVVFALKKVHEAEAQRMEATLYMKRCIKDMVKLTGYPTHKAQRELEARETLNKEGWTIDLDTEGSRSIHHPGLNKGVGAAYETLLNKVKHMDEIWWSEPDDDDDFVKVDFHREGLDEWSMVDREKE